MIVTFWAQTIKHSVKVVLPKGCFLERLNIHLCSKALSLSLSCRGNIWVIIPLDKHFGTEKRKQTLILP